MRRTFARMLASIVAGAALACAGVHAQAPEGATPASKQAPTAPELDERERFVEAMRLYREQRYDEVLPILQGLLAAHSEPLYLFNLGQTHRMLGDCAAAVDAYRRYLETPMPNAAPERRDARHSARAYVRALAPCTAQAAARPARETVAPTPPPVLLAVSVRAEAEPAAPPRPAMPAEAARPHSTRAVLWASGLLFGAGAACAVAASYWGLKARALEGSLEERYGGAAPPHWDEQAEQDLADGEKSATRARWVGSFAVLAVASGSLVLLLMRRGRQRPRRALSLLPGRYGAEASWTTSF